MKIILSILMAIAIVILGCKSGPSVDPIYKAEVVVITTVDTGMKGWRDYVVAGHATLAQVDAVKAAYKQYYDAQMIAKAALEKYIASKAPGDATPRR